MLGLKVEGKIVPIICVICSLKTALLNRKCDKTVFIGYYLYFSKTQNKYDCSNKSLSTLKPNIAHETQWRQDLSRQNNTQNAVPEVSLFSRKTSRNLTANISYAFPMNIRGVYSFSDHYFLRSSDGYQTNRFSLSKSTSILKKIFLSLNASLERKHYREGDQNNTSSFYIGLNLSYNFGNSSIASGASFSENQSDTRNDRQHSGNLGFSTSAPNHHLTGRVYANNSGEHTRYSSSLFGSIKTPYGRISSNASYSDKLAVNIDHEYMAAVNDKSYSLRSQNSTKSRTGVIFDLRNIPAGSHAVIGMNGSRHYLESKIETGKTVFIPINPGKYRLRIDGDDLSSAGITSVFLKEQELNLFMGDIKTVSFDFMKPIVVNYLYNGAMKEFTVEGCHFTDRIDSNYEMMCNTDQIINDQLITLVEASSGKQHHCNFDLKDNYSNMYYSLGRLHCE